MRRSFTIPMLLLFVPLFPLKALADPADTLIPPPPGKESNRSGSVNAMPFDPRAMSSLVGSSPKSPPTPEPGKDRTSGGTLPGGKPEGAVPSAEHSERTLGDVFALDHEERILKEKIKIKKLRKQLEGKPKIREAGEKGDPVVVSGAGMGDRRFAVLSWPDGREIRVSLFERLPDGGRVVRIDGSGVEVRTKGGGTIVYPYGKSFRDQESGPAGGYPSPGFFPPPTSRNLGGPR